MLKKETPVFLLDRLTIFFVVYAVLALAMMAVFTQDPLFYQGVSDYLLLFILGLGLMAVTRRHVFSYRFRSVVPEIKNVKRLDKAVFAMAGALAGVIGAEYLASNLTVLLRLNLYSGTLAPLFFANGGVIEEWFFEFWLFFWMIENGVPTVIAAVTKAGVFDLYHLAVYGGSPALLLFVFLSGIALAYGAVVSERGWPMMIVHGWIINVLATP